MDEKGERVDHAIQVLQIAPNYRNTLGMWDPVNFMNLAKNRTQLLEEAENIIVNRSFVVASMIVCVVYNLLTYVGISQNCIFCKILCVNALESSIFAKM